MAVYWSSGQDSDLTAKGAGSIPGRGTKILQVVWQGDKKKKNHVSWHQEPMRAHLGVSHLTHTGRVCVCVYVCVGWMSGWLLGGGSLSGAGQVEEEGKTFQVKETTYAKVRSKSPGE